LEEKSDKDRDYRVTADDITSYEKEFGKIPKGGIVSGAFHVKKASIII